MKYMMKMRLAHVKEPQIKKRMIIKKNNKKKKLKTCPQIVS